MSELGSIHTTEQIQIVVEPQYLPEESQPADSFWVFTYEVVVTNMGKKTVQLLSRHWIITDANGKQDHVRGPGVVGKTPLLKEGESFSYTSFCPLPRLPSEGNILEPAQSPACSIVCRAVCKISLRFVAI